VPGHGSRHRRRSVVIVLLDSLGKYTRVADAQADQDLDGSERQPARSVDALAFFAASGTRLAIYPTWVKPRPGPSTALIHE